jgi:hypothetical protein
MKTILDNHGNRRHFETTKLCRLSLTVDVYQTEERRASYGPAFYIASDKKLRGEPTPAPWKAVKHNKFLKRNGGTLAYRIRVWPK